MAFRADLLPKVLYKPRSAFEEMKRDVSASDGVIMGVIILAVGSLIGYGILMGAFEEEMSVLPGAAQGTIASATITSTIMGIVIGLIALFVIAAFAGWIAASWANQKFNIEKTIGLVGYSTMIDFLKNIVMALIIVVMIKGLIGTGKAVATGGMGAEQAMGQLTGSIIGILVLMLIFFIWELWIKGTAVAVANNSSTAKGVVSWLIAAFIVGLILTLVQSSMMAAGSGFM